MARRHSLQADYAVNTAKNLAALMKSGARSKARTALDIALNTIPSLQHAPRTEYPPEQVRKQRLLLLNTLMPLFDEYPVLCADAVEILSEAEDYEIGGWLANSVLAESVSRRDRNRYNTPATMIDYAASFNTVDTELLLAISAFYAQQDKANAGSANDNTTLSAAAQNNLVAKLAHSGAAKTPAAKLALINAALNLPYRQLDAETNRDTLQLAVDSAQALFNQCRAGKMKGVPLAQVWKVHLRAGTHMASHLMANGEVEAGRAMFEAYADSASDGIGRFPQDLSLHGAKLRLLHKWFKYEPDTIGEFSGRRMLRSMFNAAVAKAEAEGFGDSLSINIRRARFERDAGSRKLGYRFLARASKQAPRSKYVRDILQLWLLQDNDTDAYQRQVDLLERLARRSASGPRKLRIVRHPA